MNKKNKFVINSCETGIEIFKISDGEQLFIANSVINEIMFIGSDKKKGFSEISNKFFKYILNYRNLKNKKVSESNIRTAEQWRDIFKTWDMGELHYGIESLKKLPDVIFEDIDAKFLLDMMVGQIYVLLRTEKKPIHETVRYEKGLLKRL